MLLKPVLLIAIVAVAMIGVMVPSVFAESTHIVETAMGSGAPGCETSNACYLPADITISTGDTVQWDNVDTAAHTVTGGSPADGPSGAFDSSLLMIGEDYSFTFNDADNYDYFCMLHPWMIGTIIVQEAAANDDAVLAAEEELIVEQSNELEYTSEPEYIPESESPKSDLNTVPISKEIFDRKKTDTISSILFAPGFSYHFSLERDFTSELGLTESYYQLYKIIDDKTTKRIGDLRFYLGSSEWWDHNASLQENDTSGFNNIFKVKFFIMHKGDSVVAQQISNNLSSALRVLVPEWSNEIGSTSNTWLIDSLNYSERNDQSKRENSIMTQEKEIKILHDDLDLGTITLIVTENADTIKIPSVSTDTEILDQLLDDPTPTSESKGGGCLIATATYGSEMALEVQQLRELRDNTLLNTESGTAFMGTFNDIYYSFSPYIADMERENPLFKEAVKLAITPMISSLSLMENAESESEVLSIGISVIMLNLGMYLGVPAIVIVGIRKIR